ncbi:MAG: hypothetical protein HC784_01530 [Hydrococcus sp. CSU_1_8]|nr:hypothetical protein [Hydrococcus sp. CSU_1_8]
MNVKLRRKFIELTKRRIKPGSGSVDTHLLSRTWSYPVANLSQLITVPYIIVGGVATRLYMPERMTLDLDILIHTDRANELYQSLKSKAIFVGDLSIGGTSWELSDKTILDILVNNSTWVNSALKTPKTAPDGQPVIDLPYLILMKLAASRTTDISDISRMLGQASNNDLQRVKDVIKTYDRESLEDLDSLIELGRLELGNYSRGNQNPIK